MKFLAALALTVALVSGASAQLTTDKGSKSDLTLIKIRKLDLLIKILPLAIKKEQYPDILLAIEKARAIEKKELTREDDVLEQLDTKVTDALDSAMNKGTYPDHDLQVDIATKMSTSGKVRGVIVGEAVDIVNEALTKALNAGQIKAMAGTFEDSFIDPSAKKGDLKDPAKIRFFIQYVLLDPLAYDLLVTLSTKAS